MKRFHMPKALKAQCPLELKHRAWLKHVVYNERNKITSITHFRIKIGRQYNKWNI